MGLRIFELCKLCSMCFSHIGENHEILPLSRSTLILYLTEAKKQINGASEQFKVICKVRKAGLSYTIQTYPDLVMEK